MMILILSLAISFLLTAGCLAYLWAFLRPWYRNNRYSYYCVFVETGAFGLAYSSALALHFLKFERMIKNDALFLGRCRNLRKSN